MTKFFKYILLLVIILIFIIMPFNVVYAEELFRCPVVGEFTITNGPGEYMHIEASEYAIDISTDGKPVNLYAVADGKVETAGTMLINNEDMTTTVPYSDNLEGYQVVGFGNYIIIDHEDLGYKSLYAHLSEINVNEGDSVTKGHKIAKSGNTGLSTGQTGMHLHFEVRKDGESVDLIDLMEDFSRDNFTGEYWDWRNGNTSEKPKYPSGDIKGKPVEISESDLAIVGEENSNAFDKIINFFYKIGDFFASVFSYRSPSEVRAEEKESKLIEDKHQLAGSVKNGKLAGEMYVEEDVVSSVRANKMPLKIVFAGLIGFHEQDIFLLDLENSILKRLTNSMKDGSYGTHAIDPEISNDFSKIVFSSNWEQGIEVYIMNSDGAGQKKLTNSSARNPSISKDGKKISYIDTDHEGHGGLFIMDSDGSQQAMLHTENILESYSNPSFSFDNNKIVFEGYVDYDSEKYKGTNDLFIIDSDGTKIRRIVINELEEHNPSFSPDDMKIVFDAFQIEGSSIFYHNAEIFIIESDGSHIQQLTNNEYQDYDPIFISAGEKILFESNRNGFTGIYIMDIDGNNQTLITSIRLGNYNPTISPDGKKIAFVSSIDGNPELYLMNSDGSEVKRLTNNDCFDGNPIFSPTGSSLFYNSEFRGKGIYNIDINTLNIKKVYKDVFFNNLDFTQEPEKMVFEVTSGFYYSEILIMDQDGSNALMLTSNDVYDGNPVFNADSSKIIYISNVDLRAEIYTMNLDGSNKHRVTNNEVAEYKIQSSSNKSELLVLDGNGLSILDFIDLEDKEKEYIIDSNWVDSATFLPNSPKILFLMTVLEDNNSQIYITDREGSNYTKLAENINSFIISPDGKKIFIA